MKKIKEVLSDEQKRVLLIERWNKRVLCHKPSDDRIRKYKKQIQNNRRDRKTLVIQSGEYFDTAIEQAKLLQEMRSGEQNGLGDTGRQ